MASTVWYVSVKNSDDISSRRKKLKTLLNESGVLSGIKKDDFTCLKLHFGEERNTGYINPHLVKEVVLAVSGKTDRKSVV